MKKISLSILVFLVMYLQSASAQTHFTIEPVFIGTSSKPTCNAANVGKSVRYVTTNVGYFEVCLQTGASTYEWKNLVSAGGTTVLGYVDSNTSFFIGSNVHAPHWADEFSTVIGQYAANGVPTNVYHNTILGWSAHRTRNGSYNTALGHEALRNGTGGNNVGIGWAAGIDAGSDNVIIGRAAMNTGNGSRNIAVGYYALANRAGTNTAEDNVAIGYYSARDITTGDFNVALGGEAGARGGGADLTTGSYNTFLGAKSGFATSTQRTNATAVGYDATVDADNTVVLGNASVTQVLAGSSKQAAFVGDKLPLDGLNTAPATSTDACSTGEIRFTADYIYVCTATNTWKRSLLDTF